MKKISFFIAIISLLTIAACRKQVDTSHSEENPISIPILEQAQEDMKRILSLDDYARLNWKAFTIDSTTIIEQKVLIVPTIDIKDTLLYSMVGSMNIYSWKGEVHLARNSPN